jgi:hypothetical protein
MKVATASVEAAMVSRPGLSVERRSTSVRQRVDIDEGRAGGKHFGANYSSASALRFTMFLLGTGLGQLQSALAVPSGNARLACRSPKTGNSSG